MTLSPGTAVQGQNETLVSFQHIVQKLKYIWFFNIYIAHMSGQPTAFALSVSFNWNVSCLLKAAFFKRTTVVLDCDLDVAIVCINAVVRSFQNCNRTLPMH